MTFSSFFSSLTSDIDDLISCFLIRSKKDFCRFSHLYYIFPDDEELRLIKKGHIASQKKESSSIHSTTEQRETLCSEGR